MCGISESWFNCWWGQWAVFQTWPLWSRPFTKPSLITTPNGFYHAFCCQERCGQCGRESILAPFHCSWTLMLAKLAQVSSSFLRQHLNHLFTSILGHWKVNQVWRCLTSLEEEMLNSVRWFKIQSLLRQGLQLNPIRWHRLFIIHTLNLRMLCSDYCISALLSLATISNAQPT